MKINVTNPHSEIPGVYFAVRTGCWIVISLNLASSITASFDEQRLLPIKHIKEPPSSIDRLQYRSIDKESP